MLFSICACILSGCLNQGETMTLLDEKITMVEVSRSNGVGAVNEDALISIEEKESIEMLEQIIKTSISQKQDIKDPPIMISLFHMEMNFRSMPSNCG